RRGERGQERRSRQHRQGAARDQVRRLERHHQLLARRGAVLAAVDAADAVHAVHEARDGVHRGEDHLSAGVQDGRSDSGAEAIRMDAHLLSQYVLSGLVIGVIYSLMALGITFIYGIMKMINWAMGEFYMIGSYVQYALLATVLGQERWYVALPIAMATAFVIGVITQRVLLRPMYVRGLERRDEYATIITIALMVLFRNLAIVLGGPNQSAPRDYARPTTLLTLPISGNRFVALVGTLALLVLFDPLVRKACVVGGFRGGPRDR